MDEDEWHEIQEGQHMQAREWQRIAHAQPWLLRVAKLEPFALEVLEWPAKGVLE